MRLNISLRKIDHNKSEIENIQDESSYLISTDVYWLSRDVVFISDILSGRNGIREINRSEGRFNVASSINNSGDTAIRVYVVYPSGRTPLLVGVLGYRQLSSADDKIIFELPLDNGKQALSVARDNGFEVNEPEFSGDYLDPDIIDTTYHNGSKRSLDSYRDISYKKLISKALELRVYIDYAAGAEI